MEPVIVEERCIGLDPLSRSTMKLFVQDILHLQPAICPTLKNAVMHIFKGHVVNRVEIMGIIVRADKRAKRHCYAVDDGTGVIQCTYWKNSQNDILKDMEHSDLPRSLQIKLAQLQAGLEEKEEGFNIGDLILVRGGIKTYNNCPEIDVLDHRILEGISWGRKGSAVHIFGLKLHSKFYLV
ncbi:hypothetical protein PoB_007077600 [Plakobranchus ocellatus]|uniref:CST complex subunit STN1 n=1 Tax=Plakobranchus ocellatus TaxID=259542 RepID=A0AAV4DJC6_9GAST|nr:hypothetical protein PoB_007077600 [Plakobranchus ocellatus]